MPMNQNTDNTVTRKDFIAHVKVRWCPGCGDYAILNAVQKTLPELGLPKENFVFVSGIGCSSRFPYYLDTYGFHTIHGRAPTVATGIKLANPELSVWVMTGDGDALSIGTNHLLHVLRRNPDINILLFNNRIYGLTKGQSSPTSEMGKCTKSTPMGSVEHPVNPLCVALASESTFVARTADIHPKHMVEIFTAAARHKGTSFVEIFQNCVIFNNHAWEGIAGRDVREDRLLTLEHGKPLVFGKNMDKAIRLNGLKPEVISLSNGGMTLDDALIHNERDKDPTYAYLLTQMTNPEFPIPIGIFRSVEDRPVYEEQIESQKQAAIKENGKGSLRSLLRGNDFWEVKEKKVGDKKIISRSLNARNETDEQVIMKEQSNEAHRLQVEPMLLKLSQTLEIVIKQFGSGPLISLAPDNTVYQAIQLLKQHSIGCLPVISKVKPVGILSERDILLKVLFKSRDVKKLMVSDVMTEFPETLQSSSSIGDALNKLAIGGFRHLLVSKGKNAYSVVSVRAIMRYLASNTLQ